MKGLIIGGSFILLLAVTAFINNKSTPAKYTNRVINGKGFALLELFTSEGCSSCPPADELLAKVQTELKDKPVYLLAYHVDYWNRFGWKDVFSSPVYSKRQMAYSRWLNAQVYTPQLVVNGSTELVGSDEPALRKAVSWALGSAPLAGVSLQAQRKGNELIVNYTVTDSAASENKLLIAIVQKAATSKVSSGENGGLTLSHVQIVRDLQTVDLSNGKKGISSIKLPQGFNANGWEIIGFVQNAATGEVLAASKAGFDHPAAQK